MSLMIHHTMSMGNSFAPQGNKNLQHTHRANFAQAISLNAHDQVRFGQRHRSGLPHENTNPHVEKPKGLLSTPGRKLAVGVGLLALGAVASIIPPHLFGIPFFAVGGLLSLWAGIQKMSTPHVPQMISIGSTTISIDELKKLNQQPLKQQLIKGAELLKSGLLSDIAEPTPSERLSGDAQKETNIYKVEVERLCDTLKAIANKIPDHISTPSELPQPLKDELSDLAFSTLHSPSQLFRMVTEQYLELGYFFSVISKDDLRAILLAKQDDPAEMEKAKLTFRKLMNQVFSSAELNPNLQK